MARLVLGGRRPKPGDAWVHNPDRDEVETYYRTAGAHRARAAVAAEEEWLSRQGEGRGTRWPGYVMIFVMAVVLVLWVIA